MKKEQFENLIANFEKIHGPISWLSSHARELMFKDVATSYEIMNGTLRHRYSGSSANAEEMLISMLQSSKNYARVRNFTQKYVSPFKPRSAETIARHKAEMKSIVEKIIDSEGLEFTNDKARRAVVDFVSKHYIAGDSENGVSFHRVNSEGVTAPNGASINELIFQLGAGRFIDPVKTDILQKSKKAELMKTANGLLPGYDPKKDKAELDRTIANLEQINKVAVGKNISVDKSLIETEYMKKLKIERNLPGDLASEDRNKLLRACEFYVHDLSLADDIKGELHKELENTIQQNQTWEF